MSAYLRSIATFFELLRWANCAMAACAALIGTMIAFLALPDPVQVQLTYEPLVVFLVVFVITGAGNAVNDYFDSEIDRVNRPKRPIPSGRITRSSALYISISLFCGGIILSLLLGPICLFLAAFNSVLLFLYAHSFKGIALLGNAAIGYLTGSTFLFGSALGIFEGTGIRSVSILFFLAVLATLAREIIKDIQDMEGDRQAGARTLPIIIGKDRAARVSAVLGLSGVMLSPLPFFFNNVYGISYLIVIFIADLLFLVSVNEILLKDDPERSSKLLKMAMLVALIAFVLGTVL